jgi:hypothetical protein
MGTPNTTDRLGYRSVLQRVEISKSALRAANPGLPHASVWRDIFDSDAVFLNKIVKALDLGQWSACLGRKANWEYRGRTCDRHTD